MSFTFDIEIVLQIPFYKTFYNGFSNWILNVVGGELHELRVSSSGATCTYLPNRNEHITYCV